MFGKKDDNNQVLPPTQQVHRATPMLSGQPSTDQASVICRGMTVVGKIFGEGTVQVFGRIEGELKALTVSITESAEVEGDIVAEELSVAGLVKGTIHANCVKLNGTAVAANLAAFRLGRQQAVAVPAEPVPAPASAPSANPARSIVAIDVRPCHVASR